MVKRALACFVVSGVMYFATIPTAALAQASESSSQSAPSLGATGEAFVLGASDEISLDVVDMPEVSEKSLRINPDGDIDLPLIGSIHASGLTTNQLKTLLASRLSKYITDPEISVNLLANRSLTFSVIGEVNSPGVRELTRPLNLIEVISLAGGVKTDAGPRVIVTRDVRAGTLPSAGSMRVLSGGYSTVTLSLEKLLAATDPAANFLIAPGDIISIPKEEIVYVVGDVHRSGGFPLSSHDSITLLQALSLAEGLGPDAATNRAKILRPIPGGDGKPKEIPVDVKAIVAGKNPDLPLYANDILFIPNSSAKSGAKRAAEAILQVATGVLIYR